MRLSDLKQLSTSTVTIRGQVLTVRAVTMREEQAIIAALPEPQPFGQTHAQREADLMSESFAAKRGEWSKKTAVAKAALAAGITRDNGEAFGIERPGKWVAEWAEEVFRAMTVGEVNEILTAVAKAEGLFRDEADFIGSSKKAGLLICPPIPQSWSDPDGSQEWFKLPDRYSETELSALLRAAERFGVDPAAALEWPPEVARIAHLFNVLRTAEEVKAKENEMKLIAAACGAKVQ